MAHVNLVKQVKIDDRWVLRSIPKKANGQRDWSALPDGNYFIEFREKGKRRRLPAEATVAQALEVQRRKQAELEALAFGIIVPRPRTEDLPKPAPIDGLIDRYLDQIETLKKPNTFRKYNAVLRRFAKHFAGQTLDAVSVEDLNDFIVKLKKGGMSPNTVLHNVIIIPSSANATADQESPGRCTCPNESRRFPASILRRNWPSFWPPALTRKSPSSPHFCSLVSVSKR
jgi:hypothetical protein